MGRTMKGNTMHLSPRTRIAIIVSFVVALLAGGSAALANATLLGHSPGPTPSYTHSTSAPATTPPVTPTVTITETVTPSPSPSILPAGCVLTRTAETTFVPFLHHFVVRDVPSITCDVRGHIEVYTLS
jgi:hypothetical protein